jgi:hypothetical protein
VLALICAISSYIENTRLATVPGGTTIAAATQPGEYVLQIPKSSATPTELDAALQRSGQGQEAFPIHAGTSNRPWGILFLSTTLLVIVLTIFQFRGLWSFIVLIVLVALSFSMSLLGVWDSLLSFLQSINVQINSSTYLMIASGLGSLWFIMVLVIDRQRSVTITATEVRFRTTYGNSELAFPIEDVTLEHLADDALMHWILGFGSGDVLIRTKGNGEFYFPNVFFLPQRLKQLQAILGPERVITKV